MLTYKNGTTVGKGTYWGLSNGRRVDMTVEGALAGADNGVFIKMPSSLVALSVPFLGLLYSLLMPFIGIGTVIVLASCALFSGMYNVMLKSVSFGWRPRNAYLSGKKRTDDTDEPMGHC